MSSKTIKASELKSFAQTVVKEELEKAKLREATDFFAPIKLRSGRIDFIKPKDMSYKNASAPKGQKQFVFKKTIEAGYKDFSDWLLQKFPNRFPEEVKTAYQTDPMALLNWINQNPTGGMSPFQLRHMWAQMPAIKHGLQAIPKDKMIDPVTGKEVNAPDEDEDDIENAKNFEMVKNLAKQVRDINASGEGIPGKTGRKNQTGEATFDSLTQDLGGVTVPTVKNIQTSGFNKIKGIAGYEPEEEISGQDMHTMFHDRTTKMIGDQTWQTKIEDAADKYVQILQAANGDIDEFYAALVGARVISGDEISMLRPQEEKAVLHLLDLAKEGNVSEAEDLVLQDLMKSIEDETPIILRSFQNVVAKVFHDKTGDDGKPVKKGGRPPGSKNKPKVKNDANVQL
jgi:hypothetical protein